MRKFHAKYVAQKLGLDLNQAAQVAQVATEQGRLPDDFYRGTEHLDGYSGAYVWLRWDGWSAARVNCFFSY